MNLLMKPFFVFFCAYLLQAGLAYAQVDSNYEGLSEEGFGGVSRLLQSMTPQQREKILKQANANMADLQKLSPQQQDQLLQQMRAISKTIDFDKIDPAKVDTSKTQSVAATQKNLNTYQQKYQRGVIKNGVVIYPSGDGNTNR